MLAGTDFTWIISKKKYKKQMPVLRERLACLQKASWDVGLPVIILLEGWETIPKGGLVRSLTEPLDPRGFIFHTVRSPQADEKARPWMWRFWLKIPERGQWAIFDQSWYRRVLLERQQEKISERDLRRAFRDINDFERTLSDDGALILKYFLHIEKAAYKSEAGLAAQHAETVSDGAIDTKNLARRYDQLHDLYEDALRHTDKDYAPWTILPAEDKRTARHLFLKTIVKALQKKLDIPGEPKQRKAKSAALPRKSPAEEDTLHEPAPVPSAIVSTEQPMADTSESVLDPSTAVESAARPVPESPVEPEAASQPAGSSDTGVSEGAVSEDGASGADTVSER